MRFDQRSIWELKSIRVEPLQEEEQQQHEQFERRKASQSSQ